MTQNLVKVQDMLGDRFGTDYFFISVSLDPDVDTPAKLDEYARLFGAKAGWTFCTGEYDEIEDLRHALGVYDPDPIVDADRTQHAGIAVIGSDTYDRWAGIPSLIPAKQIRDSLLRLDPREGGAT